MDLHYKQEVSVGLLVIGSVALFAGGLALLSGKKIGPSKDVIVAVRFQDVLGLRTSDPVQTSGFRVGRVENMVLEDVGRVMVYLKVSQEYRPHADATVQVASLDFFGTKYINYRPGSSPEMLPKDAILTGAREMGMAEGAAGLAQRATEAIAAAQAIFNQRTADDIHNTMVAATKALDVAAKLGTGPQLQQAVEAVHALQVIATRLDSILANPSIKKSLDQVDELTTSLREMTDGLSKTSQTMSSLLQNIERGKGTIGKAATDTMMYHNINETMVKVQKLIDDVQKNPGRYINVKVF